MSNYLKGTATDIPMKIVTNEKDTTTGDFEKADIKYIPAENKITPTEATFNSITYTIKLENAIIITEKKQ